MKKYKFALREDLKEEKQFLPTRAEEKSSGWDVRAALKDKTPLIIKPFGYAKIPLGFRAFCPEGWWYNLVPRSSTFGKKFLHCLYGTIDETYEGEVVMAVQYIPEMNVVERLFAYTGFTALNGSKVSVFSNPFAKNLTINFGDAIGQIIPVKRQEMVPEETTNEEYDLLCEKRGGKRGIGGFGSSDNKLVEKEEVLNRKIKK